MSERTKYPPGHGYAWREGWQERLYELIRERGFSSVTEFADSRPGVNLIDLADDLGGGDVAAVQLEWRLVAEAEASDTMERCARSILARELRRALPEGWRSQWVDVPGDPTTPLFRMTGALVDVIVAVPDRYQERARAVCDALEAANLPAGWLPADSDDPILVEIFAKHWRAQP